MGQSHQQYYQRSYQWHSIPANEPDFDALYNGVEWGPVLLVERDAPRYRDREDRHNQFFQLFSTTRAQDDLDLEIFIEASSVWIKRQAVSNAELSQLICRRLRRSRRYAWLTETEVSARLARLRIY